MKACGLLAVTLILAALNCGCGFFSREPDLLLQGTVTNEMTGEPIPGAVVSDGTYGREAPRSGVSNQNGFYSYMTWYEEHTIWAEAPGYERKSDILITKLLGKETEKTMDFRLRPLP